MSAAATRVPAGRRLDAEYTEGEGGESSASCGAAAPRLRAVLQPRVPVQTPGVRRACPTRARCCALVLSRRLNAEAALSALRSWAGGGTGRGCPRGAAANQ